MLGIQPPRYSLCHEIRTTLVRLVANFQHGHAAVWPWCGHWNVTVLSQLTISFCSNFVIITRECDMVMFSVASVCVSVCLSVCNVLTSKRTDLFMFIFDMQIHQGRTHREAEGHVPPKPMVFFSSVNINFCAVWFNIPSTVLSHVDTNNECFIFNLLLKLLTVSGERLKEVIVIRFSWRSSLWSIIMILSDGRIDGRNL